jgi:hypothetical protein
MTKAIRRRLPMTTAILLLTWAAAYGANDSQFWMGSAPSVLGVVASLVAVGAWPAAVWFLDPPSGSGFVRLATGFWVAVVAGTPVVAWMWSASGGLTVGQGYGVVLLLMRALEVPLYGLTGLLLMGEPMKTMLLGAGVFAVTLVAYVAKRHVGRPTSQSDAPV